MQTITTKSVEETERYATSFMENIEVNPDGATLVSLYGDLGSGKTTFVKQTAKMLGIEEIVTSPTFVLIKKYDIEHQDFDRMIHIDAYRLAESGELLALGWEEMIKDKRNIIFIEWPKYVEDVLPEATHKLSFNFIDENTREIVKIR